MSENWIDETIELNSPPMFNYNFVRNRIKRNVLKIFNWNWWKGRILQIHQFKRKTIWASMWFSDADKNKILIFIYAVAVAKRLISWFDVYSISLSFPRLSFAFSSFSLSHCFVLCFYSILPFYYYLSILYTYTEIGVCTSFIFLNIA